MALIIKSNHRQLSATLQASRDGQNNEIESTDGVENPPYGPPEENESVKFSALPDDAWKVKLKVFSVAFWDSKSLSHIFFIIIYIQLLLEMSPLFPR